MIDPLGVTVPRPLTPDDIPAAVALSAAFGWPHRPEDWALMLRLGQGRKIAKAGQLQGTIMWWPLGPMMVSVGMVMVPAPLQGQGIGTRLMQTALAANAGKAMRLHATLEGLALYRQAGFEETGMIDQSQGIAVAPGDLTAGIGLADRSVAAQIIAADRELTGLDRQETLLGLLMDSEVAVAAGTDDGLRGYALCRTFGKGRVIGPVVAADTPTAKALIALFLQRHAGRFLRIDTLSEYGLGPWLATYGLVRVGSATVMNRGRVPGGQIFALASQALG